MAVTSRLPRRIEAQFTDLAARVKHLEREVKRWTNLAGYYRRETVALREQVAELKRKAKS